MIERDLAPGLKKAARQWPSVTLTGPRQSGKTVLCRSLFPQQPYETLEAPDTRAFAIEDPRAFLARFPRGAVLDEIQRAPDLLSYLQGVIDADPAPGRWILTGPQNLALLETLSQSLAGRTAIYNLLPLTGGETIRFPRHPETLDEVLFTGSYPRIFDEGIDPGESFRSYGAAYVERDVRTIANVGNLATFHRFVALCAGRTAQLLNYSALAGDCGVSQPTARAWLSILETSFLTFRLPAFHGNIRKRLVKMPKLHFYDTGLVCWLLGIRSPGQLRLHPLRGPIFETWVVSEVAKQRVHRGEPGGLSFYRDKNGAEADLILQGPAGPASVEAKTAETASPSLFTGAERVRRRLAGEDDPPARRRRLRRRAGATPGNGSPGSLAAIARVRDDDARRGGYREARCKTRARTVPRLLRHGAVRPGQSVGPGPARSDALESPRLHPRAERRRNRVGVPGMLPPARRRAT